MVQSELGKGTQADVRCEDARALLAGLVCLSPMWLFPVLTSSECVSDFPLSAALLTADQAVGEVSPSQVFMPVLFCKMVQIFC